MFAGEMQFVINEEMNNPSYEFISIFEKSKVNKACIPMMKRISLLFIFISTISFVSAQNESDSTRILHEVTVKAYMSEQSLIGAPSSVTVINQKDIQENNHQSLLPVLNSVSGVKMEERSPGSYRVSIRGSLLRSPFGVRNIKFYYDDFPLTDAGGNTYFNLIDQSAIQNIEVLKGPDGSIFGANSGGVILLETQADADGTSFKTSAGSYGFARENISINENLDDFQYNVHQAVQFSDGYRDHSYVKRYFFQTQEKWDYTTKSSLKFSGFYSDLGYQTPGGLTLAQLKNNPKSARPGSAVSPGAIEQEAGIYNKTFFGGLKNEVKLSERWRQVISISGTTTDFKNPFITNYEKRKENSVALRTYVEFKNKENHPFSYQWNTGWEFQKTTSDILNYGNDSGKATDVLAADRIRNQLQFVFSRFAVQSGLHFKAEASASLNFAKYSFEKLSQSTSEYTPGNVDLKAQLMPKLAMSYLLNQRLVLRGIISRGFSTPTTAEVRASDARINTDLKPESGWNYEAGLRMRNLNETVYLDLDAFYYRLNDAIVRRVNSNDEDYFVNAGGTDQKGLEVEFFSQLLKRKNSFLRQVDFHSSLTLNRFNFRDYTVGGNDFSGNLLTGVPEKSVNGNLDFYFFKEFSLLMNYQYNGKTSLNDWQTVFADAYHLLKMKLSWGQAIRKARLELSIGADNLFNENYSLGNDLNAFGGRYFNPAAKRNYFASLEMKFH